MVIQIMKLSIQEILRWEQWTQLPPAACDMVWQTPRQMGETAVGQRSNHIYLTPRSPPLQHPPTQPSSARAHVATYQQAKAKGLGTVCRSGTLPGGKHLQPCRNIRSSVSCLDSIHVRRIHLHLWDYFWLTWLSFEVFLLKKCTC